MDLRVHPDTITKPGQLVLFINLRNNSKLASSTKPVPEKPESVNPNSVKSESGELTESDLEKLPKVNRSSVRRSLRMALKHSYWICQDHNTSFLFYKNQEKNSSLEKQVAEAKKEVDKAVQKTQKTYPGTEFKYTFLQPVVADGVATLESMTFSESKAEVDESTVEAKEALDLTDLAANLPPTSP